MEWLSEEKMIGAESESFVKVLTAKLFCGFVPQIEPMTLDHREIKSWTIVTIG